MNFKHKSEDLTPDRTRTLQRNLHNRHIQLIALGGTIGAGFFLGSGQAIQLAGPSIILVYVLVGFLLFFIMRALGELLLSDLSYKSFIDIAHDKIGPMAGFLVGWSYWLCWVAVGIVELVGVSVYWHYWWPATPAWIVAAIFVVVLLGINLLTVRLFGELEFWFSILKLAAIAALIVCGLALVGFHFTADNGDTAQVSNLWIHGGFFPMGLSGFLAGFQLATFSSAGVELIGTTAAETHDPATTLPRAINAIPFRITLFYVGGLLILMMVTPWQGLLPTQSPFVQFFSKLHFPIAAGAVNFVVLVAAASSANGGLYSTSRMLYGLASKQNAPPFFQRLSKNHTPYFALIFSGLCLFSGVLFLYLSSNAIRILVLVSTVSAILSVFTWLMIIVSYLCYRKKQKLLHESAQYKLPGGLLACGLVLLFLAAILAQLTWSADTRPAVLISILWFFILLIAYFKMTRIKIKKLGNRPL